MYSEATRREREKKDRQEAEALAVIQEREERKLTPWKMIKFLIQLAIIVGLFIANPIGGGLSLLGVFFLRNFRVTRR